MALQLLRQRIDAQGARFMERIEKLKPLRRQVLEEGSDIVEIEALHRFLRNNAPVDVLCHLLRFGEKLIR